MTRLSIISVTTLFLMIGMAGPRAGAAAELPDATRAALKELKLDETALAGLDKELEMPAAWIEGVKAEGPVGILATWDSAQFDQLAAPFRARYPFVKIDYARAGRYDRTIKTLIAFKDGRYIADVLLSAGRTLADLKELDGVMDLREIPNFALAAPGMADPDGYWVGSRVAYRCMGYNTQKVKPEELPATWEALLDDPRWRGGRLGLSNSPDSWILGLWGIHGEKWAKDYITKLFKVVKPQLRKEGQNASLGLVMVGEFDAVIPASGNRAKQYLDRGAPAGFHCPTPVPASVSQMIVLKGSPHPNGAKIFVNWLLSKEGQLMQYAASGQNPVHKDMQEARFLEFPEQVVGRPISFRDSDALEDEQEKLHQFWTAMWSSGEVIKHLTYSGPLEVERDGRILIFKNGAETHKIRVSGSRTEVTVGGKRTDRDRIKSGMSCDVAYSGNGGEAQKVTCK